MTPGFLKLLFGLNQPDPTPVPVVTPEPTGEPTPTPEPDPTPPEGGGSEGGDSQSPEADPRGGI